LPRLEDKYSSSKWKRKTTEKLFKWSKIRRGQHFMPREAFRDSVSKVQINIMNVSLIFLFKIQSLLGANRNEMSFKMVRKMDLF